jgi:mono/diheme cytochrome c family protein
MTRAVALFLAAIVAGCNESPFPDVDLERMIHQRKYKSYEGSNFFKDGRAMRSPPAGTFAHDGATGDPALREGIVNGAYVDRIPLELGGELLQRGRARYDVFCAPCHGIAGDGQSMVASSMQLRRPPSLVDESVRAFPVGRIFQVVTHGYGLMRSYSDDLPIEERWAVVAYLRALELRAGVPLDRLPLALRTRAERELP